MAASNNLSRHELKIEHRRLAEKSAHVKLKRQAANELLRNIHDSFQELNEFFPLCRYGPIKRLIKTATTEENINDLKQWVEESKDERNEDLGEGLPGLLNRLQKMEEKEESRKKAKEDSPSRESRPLLSGGPPLGKGGQAVRKLQKVIGFNSDPIEDEDALSNEELTKRIERMERSIHYCHRRLLTVYLALSELKSCYNDSKGTYCCCRYFAMKAMVRRVIEETRAETSYVDR